MDLNEAFLRLLPQIEAELQEVVRPPLSNLVTYYGMMQYHLGWLDEELQPTQIKSGKRLRPLVCLLSCEAAGGDPQHALPAAAAVEMIHNFSLIHDDIEDGSHFRRGRRAVWDIWGEAHGINAGDGMFALARLAFHRLAEHHVPGTRSRAATLAFDQACVDLCQGQFFDMIFEDRLDVDLDLYLQMVRFKTSALLSTAAKLGAIIATDDQSLIGHYQRFGENMGMAFQFQDDILGAWGDEQLTGKSAATDIRDKKKTLLVVYVLNHPDERTSAWQLIDLYSKEGPLDERAITAALDIMERAGAREYAEAMAGKYYQAALESLDQTGIENDAQSCLRELASFLMRRRA
jgi:geranylgeranyl diphosphate synthase type I